MEERSLCLCPRRPMAEKQGHWRSGYLSEQQPLDELDFIDSSRSEAVQLRSRSEACWTPEPNTKLFFFDPGVQ
ncbi:hypothetical protein MHYP_G00291940 [Metynnis hypsauchen]